MSTAWGAALLLVARMPTWGRLFDQLLDQCRMTHESFATYLSCLAVTAGFGSPTAPLALYPEYVVRDGVHADAGAGFVAHLARRTGRSSPVDVAGLVPEPDALTSIITHLASDESVVETSLGTARA